MIRGKMQAMDEEGGAGQDSARRRMESLLVCRVCSLLLAEPVSLPCGNTCCRTCLVKELRRRARQCPCCDKPCHTRAEDQPQNVMIAQIAKAMFPELLERRLRETEAEKAKFELCLPAFFYNVPVFPGQTLCLHFFEPRYKLMMRRIIDTSRRFAYVLPVPSCSGSGSGSTTVGPRRRIALVANVCEAEFLSDDRVMVKTKLTGRYTIQDQYVEENTGGLHYCQLEPFEDDPPLRDEDVGELENLYARAKALFHGFLGPFKGQLIQEYGEMPPDAVGLSMWMASFLPFYEPEKYALVQSRCTRQRLQACLRCAASMEEMARASTRREEKSSVGDRETAAEPSQQPPPPPPPPPPPSRTSQPPAEGEEVQDWEMDDAAPATSGGPSPPSATSPSATPEGGVSVGAGREELRGS